jgi:regulator of ribonuclease activity A
MFNLGEGIVPNITDFLDANEALLEAGKIRIVAPLFRDYGGRNEFGGAIATLKIFEDNTLVREILSESGNGCVLVVDFDGGFAAPSSATN